MSPTSPSVPSSENPARLGLRRPGLIAAVATLLLMLGTEPFLSIVWDEGFTLGREQRVRQWVQALWDPAGFARRWERPLYELVQGEREPPPGVEPVTWPRRDQIDTRAKLFRPEVLAYFWPFAREEPHGHPPFYALVGMIGDVLTPWREPLQRARLGPMLLFSITAGVVTSFFIQRYGGWPAIAALGAWVLQPHLFALAHYATYDAILTSLWVLTIVSFATAVIEQGDDSSAVPKTSRWRSILAFGVFMGAALATKLTGWFLPLPFLVWWCLFPSRRAFAVISLGGLIAVATLYLCVPPWWSHPIDGLQRFFASNLSRSATIPITTMFLGRVYETPTVSLPWYNTVFLTAIVTPVGWLLLSLAGAGVTARRFRLDPFAVLVAGQWTMLLILRALPNVPGHDGVRLFLPAFGCLALMAGVGAAAILKWSRRFGRAFIVASWAEAALGLAIMMPVPLSYYSPLIGGLPGAARLGMEPTFYWDGLTGNVLKWLNTNTGSDQKIVFANYPTSFIYLRETGQLRPKIMPWEPGQTAWYVVQNRPGGMSTMDTAMARVDEKANRAAYVYRKLGVPIVWVFPYYQVEAYRAFESERERQKAVRALP